MLRLAGARLIQGVLALLVLTLIVFLMSRLSGNPLNLLLPVEATPDDRARLSEALGLDRTLFEQYVRFLAAAVQGDLGRSYGSGWPVTTLIAQRVPATVELALSAFLVSWLVGIPLGVWAAQFRSTRKASVLQGLAAFGQSAPAFWLGILLIQIFAVELRWLPAGANTSPVHLLLPTLTLAMFGIAGFSRLVRSSLLELIDGDMLNFARSKGLSETVVIWKHALRNSLIPAVGYGGVFFAGLVSSSVVVEVVFAWPGIGLLTYDALVQRDFPVIQGVVLYAGAVVIAVNLLIDILYVYLDPRIRYAGR